GRVATSAARSAWRQPRRRMVGAGIAIKYPVIDRPQFLPPEPVVACPARPPWFFTLRTGPASP
ncbi:MAG: hypothetical protein P4L84_04805, partial [Isosphaeraceae bacterium]|nr:hypothetical protein [Isosphaeraceae bacterium]